MDNGRIRRERQVMGWWKWIQKERERMMMSKPTSSLVITMPRGWDW